MTLPPFIVSLLKKFPKREGGSTMHPARDWLILLGAFLALLFVSLSWNLWLFFELLSGKEAVLPASGDAAVEASAIERAETMLQARDREEALYRSEYRFVDPSR